MMLFRLNPASGTPIYVQLMEQIKHAIESRVISSGDQLPGIRSLAQELVVSPNTVVKAYTELSHEGVIELRQGAGAFVAENKRHIARNQEVRLAKNLVRESVAKLRHLDFTDDEIRRFVDAELYLQLQENVR
jgi:GntR family transcriptional regulator